MSMRTSETNILYDDTIDTILCSDLLGTPPEKKKNTIYRYPKSVELLASLMYRQLKPGLGIA